MATANQIRFFVLSKNAGLTRVATKRKLSIDDLRKEDGDVPTTGQFYVYIRVKSRDPTATEDHNGQRQLLCFFDELKMDDDTITGRRGVLHVRGKSAIALAMCIPLPADMLLCNFGLATDPVMNDSNRINLFDIELEIDEDRSTNGELYNLEEPEVQASSSSRNAGGSPPIQIRPDKAGPSTTSRSSLSKRTRRTTTSDTSTPPRSPDRQLRSNVVESPRRSRKNNLVEALRRSVLSRSIQRRSPRLADNTPSPRRTSPNKTPRAARDDSSSDTPIYSQSSPVRIVRKQNTPAPELVSITVETARVTVSERSPRRVLRNATVAPTTPQNQRPKRSTAAKTFFEEDISDSSSEEPSSKEFSSSDSDYEGRDDNNRRPGHMNLRSRSASTLSSPARSQKAAAKQPAPKSTKMTIRITPRAKRGRKRL